MTAAVDLTGVARHYRTPSGVVRALDGVDLQIAPGARTAVMGPSGCGKSTLLSVIGALETATAGTVRVLGTDISVLGGEARARWRRQHAGFIFQSYDLLPFLTAAENVALQEGIAGRAGTRGAVAMLGRLGLADHVDKLPDQLSGGQKQRVGMARCMVHNPPLILADEPTGGLDSATSAAIVDELLTVAAEIGSTVVVVTHDPLVAAAFDEVVVLRDGRIVDADREDAPGREGVEGDHA